MIQNTEFIRSLPDDTRCFYGHDYAISNLDWALKVNWEHTGYESFKNVCIERKSKGLPLLGFTISQEKDGNIFLRYVDDILKSKFTV